MVQLSLNFYTFAIGQKVRWRKNPMCIGKIIAIGPDHCFVIWPGPYELFMRKSELVKK